MAIWGPHIVDRSVDELNFNCIIPYIDTLKCFNMLCDRSSWNNWPVPQIDCIGQILNHV